MKTSSSPPLVTLRNFNNHRQGLLTKEIADGAGSLIDQGLGVHPIGMKGAVCRTSTIRGTV
jgi:hypothetical protein